MTTKKDAPTNLNKLLEMIVEYDNPNLLGNYMSAEEFVDHKTIPPWDSAPMQGGELDMTSLPTFGGTEPADTTGIWSWDATRLLVGAGGDDLEIVDRVSTENKITCMEEEHRKAKAAGVCHECFESLGDCSC